MGTYNGAIIVDAMGSNAPGAIVPWNNGLWVRPNAASAAAVRIDPVVQAASNPSMVIALNGEDGSSNVRTAQLWGDTSGGLVVNANSGGTGTGQNILSLQYNNTAVAAAFAKNGQVGTYSSTATAGMGVVPVYAAVALGNQGSSISATALQCGGATCPVGVYRVTVYVAVTTAGTAGTLDISLGWNDGAAARTATNGSNGMPPDISLTSTSNFAQGSTIVKPDGTHDITYAITLAGVTGTPKYAIFVDLERLQ
jgi:hypothetical protein